MLIGGFPSPKGSLICETAMCLTACLLHFLTVVSFFLPGAVAPQLRISYGANIGRDSIREGSDVYLECRVRANPPVKEVFWLHEGRQLTGQLTGDVNSANASRSSVIMSNQSLIIQKVHRSHRGRYQCVALNEQGESVSEPLTLKVNCKLAFIYYSTT